MYALLILVLENQIGTSANYKNAERVDMLVYDRN